MSEQDMKSSSRRVGFGRRVYDADGVELGQVRGFDEHGFYVTTDDGIEGLSAEHVRAGHEFGEGELMWRCWNCGEMGRLADEFPETCPNCGEPKEELYYFIED